MKNKQDSKVIEAAVTKGPGATWRRAQEPGLVARAVCRCWNKEGGTGTARRYFESWGKGLPGFYLPPAL